LGLSIARDSWVFANPCTGQPYTSSHIAFFKARDSAGLSSVRMHDLRHTYASLLINNGASIYEVQQLLGHYNISMPASSPILCKIGSISSPSLWTLTGSKPRRLRSSVIIAEQAG
jgi:hypothetical protein